MNFPPASFLTGICAIAVMSCEVSFGQDRDDADIRFSPTEYALQELPNRDLVAVGEFSAPVELGDDPVSLLRSRELDLAFAVQTVYKGDVLPGDVVQIRLLSDMLAYPGESISRYDKRTSVRQEKAEDVRRVIEEMDRVRLEAEDANQLFEEGEISSIERYKRIEEVNARVRDIDEASRPLVDESMELVRISRLVFVSHGMTFYRIGGAIRTGATYLIAANSIDGNVYYYSLNEMHSSVIWGEFAGDVGAEIERQQGIAPAQ